MVFANELEFEKAFIKVLQNNGWGKEDILIKKDENALINNWANILFENNRTIDKLNDCPLTNTEMQQVITKVDLCKNSVDTNNFINGKSVLIVRDNPDDKLHFGKEVSLKIYDRNEIAGGTSRYQIAEQPIFKTSEDVNDRRGDVLLLINGMPVIHVELKRSGVSVNEAANQIKKYCHEGIFDRGIFSLVQIFVAMNPEETIYFANLGRNGVLNKDFFFHWADYVNEPINDWKKIASTFLSIPMAHQLVGFFTVADNTDSILKVMRSYQYQAVVNISTKVSNANTSKLWDTPNNKYGGYVWHTTGSGKTLTSFKAAQLIANSNDADKVIFLVDRIELGTQSLAAYRGFSDDSESVQGTENTKKLISILKSENTQDVLVVTSIQKMSNIKRGFNSDEDIDEINKKRIVIIIDEAHRSTFGEMLAIIKETFPKAMYFGFTGTPILEANKKNELSTSDIFGEELHRYLISDGIKDNNVLGFSVQKVLTYKDKDLRQAVAFNEAKANSLDEVFATPKKADVYNYYMFKAPMYQTSEIDDSEGPGVEDKITSVQYNTDEHRLSVVTNILDNFQSMSQNYLFHAIFATSSINEAIEYYRLFAKLKEEGQHNLKITALFDATIDNSGEKAIEKEDALKKEILKGYNDLYKQCFNIPSYALFKKDVANRLSHKIAYEGLKPNDPAQLDLLIVVDQMLTGFDSKYVNTLYLDKFWGTSYAESIIQAFSRTNRIFKGDKKPFGFIRYYRFPHTMERKIRSAFEIYSGQSAFGVFAFNLLKYLEEMNIYLEQIKHVFIGAKILDYSRLPEDKDSIREFASLFNKFNKVFQRARAQNFVWSKLDYDNSADPDFDGVLKTVHVNIDEELYAIFVQRYKEIEREEVNILNPIPYDLDSDIIEMDTLSIDAKYMNSQFSKYKKAVERGDKEQIDSLLKVLHSSFASLSRTDQKFAYAILVDFQNGKLVIENDDFYDYIATYKSREIDDNIHKVANYFGGDEVELKLRKMISRDVTEYNINEFQEFDSLRESVDKYKAKEYLEKVEGKVLSTFAVNKATYNYLRKFILDKEYEIPLVEE